MPDSEKLNKYGCRPSGDVCIKHDSPLITFGMCEDSPEIKEFVKEIKNKAREKALGEAKKIVKEEIEGLVIATSPECKMGYEMAKRDCLSNIRTALVKLINQGKSK